MHLVLTHIGSASIFSFGIIIVKARALLVATAVLIPVILVSFSGSAQAATAVSLGTADSFAVLGGAGISNAGTTTITGDIGTSPTPTITGISTITLNGTNHGTDSVTQSAKTDLVAAYNSAASQTSTAVISGDLNGRTFVAGVYTAAAAISITGTLTLNGAGNPDSIFIFQIGAAFSAAAASQVVLTNGALACNVFWQVNGAAGIGAAASFVGTIMTTGAIGLGAGTTVSGRVLARDGAVTLDTNTISRPSCAPSASAITTQPSGAANDVALSMQPVVRIVDSRGNMVTTSTVNVVASIGSGSGTLSGTTTVAASSGIATFTNLKIVGSGNHTLIFTPTGLTAVTSTSFVLSAGTATASAITTQPSGAANDVALTTQPVIRIVDSSGNTVTTSTVNVVASIGSGSGTLSGTTAVATSSGVATFTNLKIVGSGNHTLIFTPTGLTAVTSASFVLSAGTAIASAITTQPSGAVSNTAFTTQPVIRVVDSSGNTVTGSIVNVVASIGSGSGTLSGTTTVAANSGVATFTNLKIVGSGNHTLIFTPTGLNAVTSASFVLSAGTPTASAITTQPSGAASDVALTTEPTLPAVLSTTKKVTALLSPIVENTINVQIGGTTAAENLNIEINIPKNSLTADTTVNVSSSSTSADVDSGFVSVKIEAQRTSDNSAVTTFANPIEIRMGTPITEASPSWSRDGLAWTQMPRLSQAILPKNQPDGYFIHGDGSYSMYTRHLTTFGLKRTQMPLILTSPQSELKVHETIQLSYLGGTGSGAMMFQSKNPTVCSVSSDGLISGLSIGECSVTVAKLGWGSYLDVTSIPAVFSISEFGLTNSFEGSTITFKRRAGRTTLKVTMPLKYANRLIRMEWGVNKDGKIFYGTWGNTRANSFGVATLSTSQIITLKTIIRATHNQKVIARRGIFDGLSRE